MTMNVFLEAVGKVKDCYDEEEKEDDNIFEIIATKMGWTLYKDEHYDGTWMNEEQGPDPDDDDKDNNEADEVFVWLKDTLKLPFYSKVFKKHGVDDVDAVKLLTEQLLWKMGIEKVGDVAKLKHSIDKLNKINRI